jgi:oxazoline/thiazoline dehydrogenase
MARTAGHPRPVSGAGPDPAGWTEHVVVRGRVPMTAVARSATAVSVSLPGSTVTFGGLDAGVHAALLGLPAGGNSLADAVRTARAALPGADLGRLAREIGRLYVRGAVALAVTAAGETLCELSATGALSAVALDLGPPDPDRRHRLSRLVLLRRGEDGLVADGLAGGARLVVRRPELAAVLAALHEPATAAALAPYGLPEPVLAAVLAVLRAGGVVGVVDPDGTLAEDRDAALALREPQDLFLHARSRVGLGPGPLGGTLRFAGTRPPLPAARPDSLRDGRLIPLPAPDPARLAADLPLAQAMQRRRSHRSFADRPLTTGELGEFLHRVFARRAIVPADPGDPGAQETERRDLPSAGGLHDLEVYLVAGRVDGVGRGLHRYDPGRHVLTEVSTAEHPVSGLLVTAALGAGMRAEPPAVVVLASRFGRLAWKYEGMAYALTLKNVGVAYEAMYLAATAMGLGGCALGSGDAALFGVATGLRPEVESSVGEFLLGPLGS